MNRRTFLRGLGGTAVLITTGSVLANILRGLPSTNASSATPANSSTLVKVRIMGENGQLTEPIEMPMVVKTDAEWRKLLTPEQYKIARDSSTELPFCGVFYDNHKTGIYHCVCCNLPLFTSDTKFDSGTGWPSFFKAYDEAHIRRIRDTSYGMVRVEEVCARCGSHLGHVFPDGPRPSGERHCLNSVSLGFTERGQPLPDILERGAPEGEPAAV